MNIKKSQKEGLQISYMRRYIRLWYLKYRISSNKRRASNKRCPLISAAPLGIEISASL